MAPVLIGTLTVLKLRIVGIHKGAVQTAGAVQGIALQGLAPGVVALGADVVREALFDGDLKAVVVGVLVGSDDLDVAVESEPRPTAPNSELRGRRLLTVLLVFA